MGEPVPAMIEPTDSEGIRLPRTQTSLDTWEQILAEALERRRMPDSFYRKLGIDPPPHSGRTNTLDEWNKQGTSETASYPGLEEDADEADVRAGMLAGLTLSQAVSAANGNARERRIAAGAARPGDLRPPGKGPADTGGSLIPAQDDGVPKDAAAAAPLPASLKREDLGEFVGRGAEKEVYSYRADPTKVVAIVSDDSLEVEEARKRIRDEHEYLEAVARTGAPVVRSYGSTIVDGRPALVLERVPGVSGKAFADMGANFDNAYSYANQNTLTSLLNIQKLLKESDMSIMDLQFIIKPDGNLVINDPMGIGRYAEYENELKAYIENVE